MKGAKACLLVFTIIFGVPIVVGQSEDEDVRQTMWEAFDAVAYLLPLSLRVDQNTDSADKILVQQHLQVLTSTKQKLIAHAQGREAEFKLLAGSLEKAIARVEYSFQDGSYIDAYFSLLDMVQNCVSCHSRLPDESDFLMGQKLFARIDTTTLEREDIAQLYVATRQFDSALDKYEEIILDRSVQPADLDLDGVLIDYLQISITVTRDLDRLRSTLNSFLQREDVPLYIRHHVQVWIDSMDQLSAELDAEPSLARARDLFIQSTELTLAPAGRERAVHDIVTSSMLRRLLQNNSSLSPEQMSEAYYLLGLIALRTMRPKPAVPEMEFLLESAIRAAPKGTYARPAFLLLEEFSYANYMDFGAREIPDPDSDIRQLRELIE